MGKPRPSPDSRAPGLAVERAQPGSGALLPRARRPTELCYAAILSRPFDRAIRAHPRATPELIAALPEIGDERRPITWSEEMLRLAVQLLGDEDLGLKAARTTQQGDYEVLEYAAASAPTVRAAIETSFRYARLVNDAADFRLEVHGQKAYAILHSIVPITRASADFRTAAYYASVRSWRDDFPHDFEVWFTHEKPADTREYAQTFGRTKIVFGAPFDGYVFDAAFLDVPLPSADGNLHHLLNKHAAQLLAQLPPAQSLVSQVRQHILETMPDGTVSADRVASRLHVSRRTLTRHLAGEGTSFKTLLDEARRHSAGHYLQTTTLSIEDIAFLLGFSESAAFVRAFKRWTQSTPAEYRRSHRL
jgi:AraC-like DNA-binding protein